MANICRRWNLFDSLRDFQAKGGAVWGTCAGLIFSPSASTAVRRRAAGAPRCLDVTVDRNFFGSQIDSFETNLPCKIPGDDNGPFRAIFIRAPAILSVGDGVEVLGEYVLPAEKRAEIDDKVSRRSSSR